MKRPKWQKIEIWLAIRKIIHYNRDGFVCASLGVPHGAPFDKNIMKGAGTVPDWLIYGMVYAGSALMVYNIIRYIRYELRLRKNNKWEKESRILQLPIFLLVMFLFGYLAIGLFGHPDVIVSGILFGGSVFVFVIFGLLQQITDRIQENERLEADLRVAKETAG